MPLNNLRRGIAALRTFDVVEETIKIINANGYYILELVRQQMAAGKDADGKPVFAKYGPFYTPETIFNKERYGIGLGRHTEWVTNYMTGRFYASLRVITEGTTFSVTSDVEYFPEIIARSGYRILDLNLENLLIFKKEILEPQLQARFKAYESGL